MLPVYLEFISVPLPDYVDSAKAFKDEHLEQMIKVIGRFLDQIDWNADAFTPEESWFITTYLIALILEAKQRNPHRTDFDGFKDAADRLRKSITQAYRGYPEWFGNNLLVHREHRKRLMALDSDYNDNVVRDFRSIMVSWKEEADNAY